MKKYLYLFLILSSTKVYAQDGVLLKEIYLPNHQYDTKVTLKYTGDFEITLKMTGEMMGSQIEEHKSPVNYVISTTISGKGQTGSPDKNNNFSFQRKVGISDLDVVFNGKKISNDKMMALKKDTILFTNIDAFGEPIIDTLTKRKGNLKTGEVEFYNNANIIMKFPNKPLNIGDTFTQIQTFRIPMIDTELTMQNIFKLVRIIDGRAIFNVTPSINLNSIVKNGDLSVTGVGDGKMVFDFKKSFLSSFGYKMNLNVNYKSKNSNLTGNATIDFDSQFTVN